MRQFKNMTEGEKIVESIFGLILGTIFTFGMGHWNAPVTRAEARDVTATFSPFRRAESGAMYGKSSFALMTMSRCTLTDSASMKRCAAK